MSDLNSIPLPPPQSEGSVERRDSLLLLKATNLFPLGGTADPFLHFCGNRNGLNLIAIFQAASSPTTIMPPPPPSASYSWKFDSSTTDEESSEGDDARTNTLTSSLQNSLNLEASEREEEDEGVQLEAWIASSTKNGKKSNRRKQKKSRKRRKKKKAIVVKNFCFGTVRIQEYERCLGVDVVPLDGSWPLGIGEKVSKGFHPDMTVDEYENKKQERLKDRLSKIQIDKELAERLSALDTLETRQWDFKAGQKNPLFRMMVETDRMHLLLDYCDPDHIVNASTGSRRSARRENYNKVFTKADVSHFRTELEDIRAHRCIRDATGCSCHRLKVYIPPENAGKTAQKKRLAIGKVKNELRKRNLLPEDEVSLSREKLERILHDVVEIEGCCSYDCPCAENNIGCQSDACECWNRKESEIGAIQASCGNPIGMYSVDTSAIDNYRRDVLKRLTFCPTVGEDSAHG